MKGLPTQALTYELVRATFIDLFVAPSSPLETPVYSQGRGQRSFCILDKGELDGESVCFGEDEESFEVRFVPDTNDVFWVWDDRSSACFQTMIGQASPSRPGKGERKRQKL